MRRFALMILIALLSACSLIDLGDPVGDAATEDRSSSDTIAGCESDAPEIAVLCQAVDLIQQNYVDDITDEQLIQTGVEGVRVLPEGGQTGDLDCDIGDPVARSLCQAIDAADATPERGVEEALTSMALGLDPNSAYLDPVALALAQDDTSGQVEGIGALVSTEDSTAADPDAAQCPVISDTCHVVIVSLFEGSPAEQAGAEPGDFIISVDGLDVDGFHIDEVTELVRGPAGTVVTLGLERNGEVRDVEITRAAIDVPVAVWEMVGDIGYVRLNVFTVNADVQIEIALGELLDAEARAIVLDLRNNPGGTLQSAIEVTSEFLADGLVVVTESPDTTSEYEVADGGLATDPRLSLWIIVNEGSASASEVTAGALGEAGRATILGHHTFGKNTVQQRFPLRNGGAMKLTIARWTTPAGTDFGTVGIIPDIEADFPLDWTSTEVVERVLELVDQA